MPHDIFVLTGAGVSAESGLGHACVGGGNSDADRLQGHDSRRRKADHPADSSGRA